MSLLNFWASRSCVRQMATSIYQLTKLRVWISTLRPLTYGSDHLYHCLCFSRSVLHFDLRALMEENDIVRLNNCLSTCLLPNTMLVIKSDVSKKVMLFKLMGLGLENIMKDTLAYGRWLYSDLQGLWTITSGNNDSQIRQINLISLRKMRDCEFTDICKKLRLTGTDIKSISLENLTNVSVAAQYAIHYRSR